MGNPCRSNRANYHVHPFTQQLLHWTAHERRDIFAGLDDGKCVGEAQQITVRLDTAGRVDWFGVALRIGRARPASRECQVSRLSAG